VRRRSPSPAGLASSPDRLDGAQPHTPARRFGTHNNTRAVTVGLGLLSSNLFGYLDNGQTDGPLPGLWVLIATGSLLMLLRYLRAMRDQPVRPLANSPAEHSHERKCGHADSPPTRKCGGSCPVTAAFPVRLAPPGPSPARPHQSRCGHGWSSSATVEAAIGRCTVAASNRIP
jgi:hypothetical protein